MKRILALFVILVSTIAISLTPVLVAAEDSIGALSNYNNPHDICEYFKGIAMTIVRETENECTASMFEGEYKIFTQIYYSGSDWCGELSNNGQVYGKKCIPRKTDTDWNTIYSVVGIMVVLFILIGIINSIGKNKTPTKPTPSNADSIKADGHLVSAVDEIEKLAQLKNRRIITQEEFDLAKKKLLK